MSILIKGIDMPKDGEWLEVIIKPTKEVIVDTIRYRDNALLKTEYEPAIQIPTPHGRLIDGEKLCYKFIDWQYAEAPDHLNTKEGRMVTDHERQYEIYLALGEAVIEIANAPTILEAEE